MKNNKGFTLIEMIISVAILGIITSVLVGIVTVNSRIARGNKERIQGTAKAVSEIAKQSENPDNLIDEDAEIEAKLGGISITVEGKVYEVEEKGVSYKYFIVD